MGRLRNPFQRTAIKKGEPSAAAAVATAPDSIGSNRIALPTRQPGERRKAAVKLLALH